MIEATRDVTPSFSSEGASGCVEQKGEFRADTFDLMFTFVEALEYELAAAWDQKGYEAMLKEMGL